MNWHFLLTHLCGISHRTWRTFHTIRTDAEWLSQYTLRYRYVTGSGLRPDTPKKCSALRNTFSRKDI
ncbi:hypothetical protein CNR82_24255 [Salmonella enterica]|nr:hypothetical protein [Salmonella enterica]EFV8298662.1 hypothetical protein [Shigella sonnei]EBL7472991.1 hypothetical protein [Salmonella enterica]EDW3285703.1 hypothetical protein [Salmonella enterica]EDW6581852.1 hypothetical protein [Salmonella enterica]